MILLTTERVLDGAGDEETQLSSQKPSLFLIEYHRFVVFGVSTSFLV